MDNNIYITKPSNQRRPIIMWLFRFIIIGFLVAAITTVVIAASSFGLVAASTSQPGNKKFSLLHPGKNIVYDNYEQNTGKLILKNDYTAIIRDKESSYVTAIKTKGFMQKTTVSGDLITENEANIIGTNPYQCNFTIKDVLYSYQCVEDREFRPQNNEPTILKRQSYNKEKSIIDTSQINLLSYNQKLLSLVQASSTDVWMIVKNNPVGDADEAPEPSTTELRQYSNGDFATPTLTKILDNKQLTGMQSYKNGVLIYSTNSTEAYFIESFNADLQKVPFADLPKIDGYGFDIIVQDNFASYYYKNQTRDAQMPTKAKNLSVSVINNLSSPKIEKTKFTYSSAYACGNDQICVYMQNEGRFVIQGDKQRSLYQVTDYTPYQNKVLLNIDNSIILYDIQNNSGYIVYSGGENSTICGIQIVRDKIRVCADSQASGDTYVLELDLNSQKSVNIIDSMNQIAKNNHVDYITAFGKTIFINTDFRASYDSNTKTSQIDEAMQKYITNSVKISIGESGVDEKKYNVIIN